MKRFLKMILDWGRSNKMDKLLLPGDWLHLAPSLGPNAISPEDFDGRLYRQDQIDHAGVPTIFARAFSFTKALQRAPQPEKAYAYFCRLVQGIFLGIIDVVPYDLSAPTKIANVLEAFEPDLEQFLVLKWQGRVVGGIYPESFVFPGAKFQEASDWNAGQRQQSPEPDYVYIQEGALIRDITLRALAHAIDRETERLGPDFVKSLYVQWVEEVRELLNLHSGETLTFLDTLSNLASREWAPSFNPPPGVLDRFTEQIGAARLRTYSGSLASAPIRRITKRLFCERLVVCSNGRLPQIPIRSEHLELIDLDSTGVRETREGRPVYHVHLKGWPQSIEWRPLSEDLIEDFEGSLLLWPNFRANDWKINYAYFLTTAKFAAAEPIARLLSKELQVLQAMKESRGCATGEPIEYVELIVEGAPAGVFKDDRPELDAGRISKTISLDFGTSNTALGIFDEIIGQYVSFRFEDLSYDLLTRLWWQRYGTTKRDASSFVPTASAANGGGLAFLPSEILFNTTQDRVRGVLARPIADFTIPFPYFRRSAVSKLLVSNFKWGAPEGFDREEIIRAYLKMVLTLALAQIRKEYLCRQAFVVPTYPLAFGPGRYEGYKGLLAQMSSDVSLFAELKRETGIAVNLAMVNPALGLQELIAESYAVEAFSVARQRPDTALMVVDIGGGTTDVAVRVSDREYVDSVGFGGNVFLKYVADNFPSYPEPEAGEAELDTSERLVVLHKLVRESTGIRAILDNYPTQQQRAIQAGIDRFFIGLFVYLERFLARHNVRGIDFFPVGNGWRLIEGYTPPHDTIPEYVRDLFRRWDIDANIILPADNDFKGAVSKGAIRIAREGTYQHPEEIAVRTILAGDLEVSGRQLPWTEDVPTGGLSEEALSFDTSSFMEQFAALSGLPISRKQKSDIALELNKECQIAVYTAPGLKFGINKSIICVFLEKIYPRLLTSLRGSARGG